VDSQRRLPHLDPKGCWLFITWHLHGSLPQSRYPPPQKASAGEAFVWMDRYFDVARSGPVFLRQEAIASLVVDSLFKGVELGHYELASFAVMANHVHVLVLPGISPTRLVFCTLCSVSFFRTELNSRQRNRIEAACVERWERSG
jgi:hypothetical protein